MSYLKKIKNKNTSFQPRNQYKKKKQKQKTCNRFRIFFLKHDATPETNFNTDLIDPFMSCYLSNVILYSLMSLKMTKKSYFNFIDCLWSLVIPKPLQEIAALSKVASQLHVFSNCEIMVNSHSSVLSSVLVSWENGFLFFISGSGLQSVDCCPLLEDSKRTNGLSIWQPLPVWARPQYIPYVFNSFIIAWIRWMGVDRYEPSG